jgi:hypothetical protein
VCWCLRSKLSLRDLVEMMAERGLTLAHTTIMRWVQRYTPEFAKRWRRYAVAVGRSSCVDETYVKIRGEWCYSSIVPLIGRGEQSTSGRAPGATWQPPSELVLGFGLRTAAATDPSTHRAGTLAARPGDTIRQLQDVLAYRGGVRARRNRRGARLVGFAEACRSGARRLRSAAAAAPGVAALSGASMASERIVGGLAGIVLGGGDCDQRPLVVARQSGGVAAALRRAMGRGGEGTAGHGRSPVIRRHRPPRRSRCGEQDDIRSQEEIAEGLAPAVGDPALRQMLWPVMQHVAALTEGAQVGQPVVGRIAVEMRCRQHDACGSQACCLHQIGPPGQFAAAIPPRRRRRVEPAPVRQAADESKVGPVTPLAPSAGTLEANAAAQRVPVWRIQGSELATDGHVDPASLPGTRATLPWRLPSRGTRSAGWLGAACRRAQAAAAQRRTDVMGRGARRMDSSLNHAGRAVEPRWHSGHRQRCGQRRGGPLPFPAAGVMRPVRPRPPDASCGR